MDRQEPQCVFSPKSEWQGELIAQFLRDNGIETHLANRGSVGLWGDGSTPLAQLDLLVPQDRAQEASQLIEQYLTEHQADDDAPPGE